MIFSIPLELINDIQKSSCLIIGEIHGTNEHIQALGEIVRILLTKRGRPIALQLELPDILEERIRSFALGEPLQGSEDFSVISEDGRWGQAVRDLLRSLKEHVEQSNLTLHCFDITSRPANSAGELTLARNVLANMERHPDKFHVIYCGNVHALLRYEPDRDRGYTTMAAIVAESIANVYSLNLGNTGGSRRGVSLMPDGKYKIGIESSAGCGFITNSPGEFKRFLSDGPYSAEWNVGKITASME